VAGTGGGALGGTAGAAGTGGSAGGTFVWPDQKIAAVSLTYDDGLDGQLKYAVPALDAAGLPGTFFLASFQGVDHVWALPNTTDPLNARHQAWQAVLAAGHELASHTLYHPCDNNNPGFQPADYDQMRMAEELDETLLRLMRLGVQAPFTFAYPCSGDKRGIGPEEASMSYAPLVAERFMAARVSDSGVADPLTVDLQQVPLFGTTDATGAELIAHVDEAIAAGGWTVFIFHGVGPETPNCDINTYDLDACALNYLCTPETAHQELVSYLASKQAEVWTATFKDVASHIEASR
jgi:peptidoglycan/xylan/chitin deacetylase (PgdA/CDA1 family)